MAAGNIAVEYESWGKPSGINATESDYWFHNLCINGDIYATLVFKTETLRKIVDSLDFIKTVSGGDHNASKMYLVNIKKLFSSDVIKAYKGVAEITKKINLMKSVDRIYYYCIILLYVILKVNLNSFYFKLII